MGEGNHRPAPLLVTAELPAPVLSWADNLRRKHYPPDRNRLRAHVTLFHALPPSVESELRHLLSDLAKRAPVDARISGIMNLGRGTAFDVDSPEMVELYDLIQDRMHGLLTPQDEHALRLHITVQNKVQPMLAKALQAKLRAEFEPRPFKFRGFGLYAWEEGLWRPIADFPFRG